MLDMHGLNVDRVRWLKLSLTLIPEDTKIETNNGVRQYVTISRVSHNLTYQRRSPCCIHTRPGGTFTMRVSEMRST